MATDPLVPLSALGAVLEGSLDLPIRFAFPDVVPLVEVGLPFAHCQLDLHLAVLPIEREGNEGVSLDVANGEELLDFGAVEQELPLSLRRVVMDVAMGILVDVRVMEPDLVILHAGEGVGDLTASLAQGLDLGSVQDNAGLEGVEDMVVAARLRVGEDFGHKAGSRRAGPSGCESFGQG